MDRLAKAVEIRQQCIINRSCNNNFFNQYPARIKVDGKAVSEAEYDVMMAAE
jgi:hypothetical protein